MELTCNRCHQSVQPGASFCPNCGLPQLVYSPEEPAENGQPARWEEAVRDASSVAWRPAMRSAFTIGLPAGVLCAFLWPVGIISMILMGLTGAWVVSLYMKLQQPAWITLGAGARIGLVTGLVSAWTASATSGITLFAMRYWFHDGGIFDNFWTRLVDVQLTQQWNSMGADAQTVSMMKAMLLSPDGRAVWALSTISFLMAASLVFAIAGGALSARLQLRRRRPHS
jgi:hypothetical protein